MQRKPPKPSRPLPPPPPPRQVRSAQPGNRTQISSYVAARRPPLPKGAKEGKGGEGTLSSHRQVTSLAGDQEQRARPSSRLPGHAQHGEPRLPQMWGRDAYFFESYEAPVPNPAPGRLSSPQRGPLRRHSCSHPLLCSPGELRVGMMDVPFPSRLFSISVFATRGSVECQAAVAEREGIHCPTCARSARAGVMEIGSHSAGGGNA
mmetsp:Transcript_3534/g.10908  ORF Transcript_3534/g.10908 Transcript_3534/m.10908 type:complete len:205 (-) Transcript_3534:608-1222(-)